MRSAQERALREGLALTADLVERRRQGLSLLPRILDELHRLNSLEPTAEALQQQGLVVRILDLLGSPLPH